jgi:choline-sulfatase
MKKLQIGIILFFILILLFLFYPQEEVPCRNCNVIIIAFDALQASHVGAYGYPLSVTPNIDRLAESSAVFMDATSPASWTVPTYVSIFTSMYPSEHGVVNRFSFYNSSYSEVANLRNLTPSAVTLAEVMRQNGYATVGFTGDAGARGAQGNSIGFDIYVDTPAGFNGFNYSMKLAADWIRNNTGKKFFMFVHGYDSHGQYQLDNFTGKYLDFNYTGNYKGTVAEQAQLREEGLRNGYVNLTDDDVRFWRAWYDEKINKADSFFGDFMDFLGYQGILNNTIVVVFSDHGTEFYEHGRLDHGSTLYQELIHVPLLIWYSNAAHRISNSRVTTLDIMPTVLDLIGISPNETVSLQMRGRSLLPDLKGLETSSDIFSETDYRLYTHKRSITTSDGWKLILTLAEFPNKTDVRELYDLNADPHEKNNLTDMELQKAYELEQRLLRHLKDMGTSPAGPWEIGCVPAYADQCK